MTRTESCGSPTETPRLENHCLWLAEDHAEVPPTELHVNKHKLGMRRLSNGGLAFPLGLNDARTSVLAPFWREQTTRRTTHDLLVSTRAPPQTVAVYFAGDEASKVSKVTSSCWLHVSFKQKAAWQIFFSFFPPGVDYTRSILLNPPFDARCHLASTCCSFGVHLPRVRASRLLLSLLFFFFSFFPIPERIVVVS